MGKSEKDDWKLKMAICHISSWYLEKYRLPLWELKGALVRNHVEGSLGGNNGLEEKIVLKAAGDAAAQTRIFL